MNRMKWQRRAAITVALVLVTSLGAGCGVSGDESREASADVVDDLAATTVPADDGAGTTSTSVAEDEGSTAGIDVEGAELPRTVTYRSFEVTLEAAESTTVEFEGPGVALDITVRNLLSEIGEFPAAAVGLVDGDGVRVQAIGYIDPDEAGSLPSSAPAEVAPDGKVERTVFVPVEGELTLAGSTFSVAEEEVLPAEVPLSGEVSESGLPLPVTVPTEPMTLTEIFDFTMTLKSAELTEEYKRHRAPEGFHLVVIDLRVANIDGNSYADGNTLRLVVDGTPLGATFSDPPSASGLVTGGADDLTFVYELPDDYEEVSLLAESDECCGGHPDVTMSIDIPALPAS